MTSKLRKFKFEDNRIVMCGEKDYAGEFVHINDIELLLREEKRGIENMKKVKPLPENPSEYDRKFMYGLDEKIDLLDHLLNRI